MRFNDLVLKYGEDYKHWKEADIEENQSNSENVRKYYYDKKIHTQKGWNICAFARNMVFAPDMYVSDIWYIPAVCVSENEGNIIKIKYRYYNSEEEFQKVSRKVAKMLLSGFVVEKYPLWMNKAYCFPASLENINIDNHYVCIEAETDEYNLDTSWKLVRGNKYEDGSKIYYSPSDKFGNIIDKFNSYIEKNIGGLFGLISVAELGWHVDVLESDEKKISVKYEYEDDMPENESRIIDLFGEYICKGLHECMEEYRCIIIYSKAIEDFVDNTLIIKYGADKEKREEYFEKIVMYVMAHEIFHAYQDFKTNNLKSVKRLKNTDDFDKIETYAEYFALRFIKDVLKDEEVFNMMVRMRYEDTDSDYRDSINYFGDIKDDGSEKRFYELFKSWEDNKNYKF